MNKSTNEDNLDNSSTNTRYNKAWIREITRVIIIVILAPFLQPYVIDAVAVVIPSVAVFNEVPDHILSPEKVLTEAEVEAELLSQGIDIHTITDPDHLTHIANYLYTTGVDYPPLKDYITEPLGDIEPN